MQAGVGLDWHRHARIGIPITSPTLAFTCAQLVAVPRLTNEQSEIVGMGGSRLTSLACLLKQGGLARPPTARVFLTRPPRVRQDAPFTQSSHVKHNLFDPEHFV